MKIINKTFNKKLKEKTDDFLKMINQRTGTYSGMGINNEDKQFRGMMDLRGVVGARGARLHFAAIGIHGTDYNKSTNLYSIETVIYNEEETLIAYNSENTLCLWSLSSNIGTTVVYEYRSQKYVKNEKNVFIFGFGNPDQNKMFREEITIELYENGDIGYNYSWGQPDGLLLQRSNIRMNRIAS